MSFIETRTLREVYSCVIGDPFFSQKCPYGLGGHYSLTGVATLSSFVRPHPIAGSQPLSYTNFYLYGYILIHAAGGKRNWRPFRQFPRSSLDLLSSH